MKKLLPLLPIISAIAVLASACSPRTGAPYWQYGYYGVMNSDAVLKVYGESGREEEYESRFAELAGSVKNLLGEIESSLSAEIQTSSVGRFNAAAAGEKVEIDYHAYSALETAINMYNLTGGAYNPAVYYSVRAYGFNGGSAPGSADDLPSEEELAAYREISEHFSEVRILEENGKFYALKPAYIAEFGGGLTLKIDLGGVGKGYAADRVNALLDENGFGYGYFNFGSSSIAFKKYPDESLNYDLHFTNPRGGDGLPQSYLLTAVHDACVSTSADKNNYFMLDSDGDGVEERFCHIIDPSTGSPVRTGVISATVIGGSAAENDALTTAIMAMGSEKAVEFINSRLTGRRVVFVEEKQDKLRFYTNIGEGGYTVEDGRYEAVPVTGGGGNVS